jgi:hypothetical protein
MGRVLAILLGFALLASPATRKSQFRRQVIGKRVVAGSAVSAGVNHLRRSPHQWGGGPVGYAQRFGSSLGTHVAKNVIEFGVAAAHNENLKYHRSNKHGTFPRLGYAVKHTFIVPRRTKRGKTVALGRISGNMGAGMISQTWMPAAGVGAGVATGGIGLGADVGANVAREFWPRKQRRHPVRRRAR